MNKTPMTVGGHKALQALLQKLKGPERQRVVQAIAEARAHGDLSENAEYDAAKNEQGLLEGRIRDIEAKLSTAQVIDVTTLSGPKVVFGATVEIEDVDTGDSRVVSIVGEDESNAEKGLISYSSPLARALIGRREEDIARVKLPSGEREYEIRSVKFIEPDLSHLDK